MFKKHWLPKCVKRISPFDEFSIGIPITDPVYWTSEECTDEQIAHVFRSATDEKIPLLEERIACLREAGEVLQEVGNPASPPSTFCIILLTLLLSDFRTLLDHS